MKNITTETKFYIDCPFCIELNWKDVENDFINLFDGKVKSRILIETENFVIIPDLSPLVIGHILLIPKNHFLSFTDLPQTLWQEFIDLKQTINQLMTKRFSYIIEFEHGISITEDDTGCISHAHWHFVPVNIKILPKLKDFKSEKINNIEQLKKWKILNKSYLFIQESNGDMYVVDDFIKIPSRFLRGIIANQLNINDLHINQELLMATLRELRNKIS